VTTDSKSSPYGDVKMWVILKAYYYFIALCTLILRWN